MRAKVISALRRVRAASVMVAPSSLLNRRLARAIPSYIPRFHSPPHQLGQLLESN